MPKLSRRPPAYSLHKKSGQARVRFEGKDYYLGPYGSRESREAYARLIVQFSRDTPEPVPHPSGPTVGELILRYWGHVQTYYRRADGKPTGEHLVMKAALKPLRRLYGSTPAAEFRATQLRLLRDEMIRIGWSRRYVNSQVGRVKRFFSWCVSEDLLTESVVGSLTTVKGLQPGRSKAREKPPVVAVPDEVVDATLPHLVPKMADALRVLRLSGARVGELISLTADQLDRTDPACWVFVPRQHKSTHKGKARTIYFGPRAIAILTPHLVRAGGGLPFDYVRNSISQAIRKACKVHGIARWYPHMLRHTAATEIRSLFGLEASQVVLGHSEADTTQIYAAVDSSKAREAMKRIG